MLDFLIFIAVFCLVFYLIFSCFASRIMSWISRKIMKRLFGIDVGRRNDNKSSQQNWQQPQQTKKKIFPKDQGEYVDFEEQ